MQPRRTSPSVRSRHLPPNRSIGAPRTIGVVLVVAALAVAGLAPATGSPGATGAIQTAGESSAGTELRQIGLSGLSAKVLKASGGELAQRSAGKLRPAVAAQVRISDPAELVAVSADSLFPEGSVLRVRVREAGKWGRWTQLHVDAEHGPDPGSAEAGRARAGSDPLLTNNATAAQVRLDTPTGRVPKGLDLTVVDSARRAADARLGTGRLAKRSATGMPPIISRAEWGADESWRRRAPVYTGGIRVGFVHHTASTSNYTPEAAAARVRAIYKYHTRSLKHSDIDYNFLVDRFGRLYEGRYGGIDRPVQGAHTAGFNEDSFAVSALGNFQSFAPSPAEMSVIKDSIARLFAWKLGMYGISPAQTVSVVSDGYTKRIRYPKGATANIPAISSHQTVNFTDCPGRYLQAEMASIRELATAYTNPVISAATTDVAELVAGSRPTVTVSASTTQPVNWRLDVLSTCSDTPVRTIEGAAAAAGPIAIAWDLLDSTGAPVLPGGYTLRITGASAQGQVAPTSASVLIAPAPGGAWGPCANVTRLGGSAAAISVGYGRMAAPDARTVVLVGDAAANPTAQAAGVMAAPLARKLAAPLLVSDPNVLSAEVRAEITARSATEVILVGGAASVSDSVAAEVSALGVAVTRLAGDDDAQTAAAVAGRFGASASAVLVAPALGPAQAMAGAALAAALGVPALFTSTDSVPVATQDALTSLGAGSLLVAVPSSVPDGVLAAGLGGRPWTRLDGPDAAAASVAIAGAFPAQGDSATLVADSAADLGPVPAAAATGRPVLVSAVGGLSASTSAYFTARAGLTSATSPVAAAVLPDTVLGTISRLLLGLALTTPTIPTVTPPAAPPAPTPAQTVTISATSQRKVYRANASPEPVRKGRTVKVNVKVTAKFSDGKWRAAPDGLGFAVYFRASGAKKYTAVTSGSTAAGRAIAYATAKKSGYWRIRLGTKWSAADYVRVKK